MTPGEGVPVRLTATYKLSKANARPDGDYTSEFVEAGTTFDVTAYEGAMRVERIPVERAWIEDGFLHVEGPARIPPPTPDVEMSFTTTIDEAAYGAWFA